MYVGIKPAYLNAFLFWRGKFYIKPVNSLSRMPPPLLWKTKLGEMKINSLPELFNMLIKLTLENIEEEMVLNMNSLILWLEQYFPREMELIIHLKNSQEFTPQQIREQLIRDLRKKGLA